jgi:hypothetical protein
MSLAEDAGGVDGFVVGSETVALNRVRDGSGTKLGQFPARRGAP